MDFDLAIVGAGTTGCAIARHLARFDLKIALADAKVQAALAGATPRKVICVPKRLVNIVV